MFTFRPTKMLATRLKQPFATAPVPPGNPYADWCVHGFHLGPPRFVIFTHTGSLLSAIAPARGITTATALRDCFIETIEPHLRRLGFQRYWNEYVSPELGDMQFAPIPNRSVMGTMNDLIYQVSWMLRDQPIEIANVTLARVPMLKQEPTFPRDKFTSLEPHR